MDFKTGLITAGAIGVAGLVFGRAYFKGGVCNIKKDLTGQVVIITGANTGIGKETARTLAQMGATVILASRDATKTLAVVEEIKAQNPSGTVEFMKLDLSDLKAVKDFVAEFKSKYQKLNILINNAGVMFIPAKTLTKDGFEMQFGVNHLGHFYLTSLLIDFLKKTAPSRIINLSSKANMFGKINWEDLNAEKGYNMVNAYAQSKLANIIFTKELQRRLGDSNIKAVAVHPGVVATELTRYVGAKWYMKGPIALYDGPMLALFGKTPVQGAQTTLYCALEDHEKLQGGAYYADCKVTSENKAARKEESWKKLWDISEKLIASKISN